MTPRTLGLTEPLHDTSYRLAFASILPAARSRRDCQTARGSMLLAPGQVDFMALLARLLGVRHYLEIGTYTGYSALAIALALDTNGKVLTCEIDAAIVPTAQRHWQLAGANKVELRLGPALNTLDALLAQGNAAAST